MPILEVAVVCVARNACMGAWLHAVYDGARERQGVECLGAGLWPAAGDGEWFTHRELDLWVVRLVGMVGGEVC